MKFTNKDIVDYYRRTELGYRLWGRNMHYGYWDKGVWHLRQATQRFNEVLAEQVRVKRTDRILDAGCGVGASSIYLARTFGCRVDGITISPRQVGFARRNAARAKVGHLVEFHEMDYLATSFPDATFDVVWGLESICYAESKERFIRESYRVLKDGGRFVVADGYAGKRDYSVTEKKMMDKWLDGWIVNYLETPEGFGELAAAAGFRNADYRDVTEYVRLTSKIMYYSSLAFFWAFHLVDRFIPLRSYPTDAVFHQHRALKRGLWQYGIFYAEK